MTKVAVVVFPGTNCDHDVTHLLGNLQGMQIKSVWHRDHDLGNADLVILPGGFSYGDYLRTGALAKVSPVMSAVSKFANAGGSVLGICNGFQILCEAGLLPGVLLQNVGMRFLSQFVTLRIENNKTPYTKACTKNSIITCPIAHFEGNYFATPDTIKELEDNGQVVFRYCDSVGKTDANSRVSNPNGSINSIAGICNKQGNVVGLMPHPERAVEKIVGFVGKDSGLEMWG